MDGIKSYTCRVCLRSNLRKCKCLFEEFKSSTIALHIGSIVQFTISVDDDFPNKICLPCFKQLQIAVEFRHKCELSHATLLSSIAVKKEDDPKEEEPVKTELQEIIKEEEDPIEIIKEEYLNIEEPEEYLEDDNVHSRDDQENIKSEETVPIDNEILRPSRVIDLQLECDDCGEIFKSKCKLKVHWNKLHLPDQLTCKKCKKKFARYQTLNKHTKDKFCDIVAKAKIEGEGKNREFHCQQCPYKTKFSYIWVRHDLMHQGGRAFFCEICNKRYTQFCSLRRHKESQHKLYEGEGTCHICGKYIKGKSKLRDHIRRHKSKSVKCETCGKVLRNKETLTIHMGIHSDIKKYTCEICAYTSHTLSNFIQHRKRVHSDIRNWFNCDLCEYKCLKRDTLKRHRDKHTSTNFPCTVCGRFYESNEQLNKHQLLHFGEKKCICNFCEKAFLDKNQLRKHVAKVHKSKKARDKYETILTKDSKPTKKNIKETLQKSTEKQSSKVTELK